MYGMMMYDTCMYSMCGVVMCVFTVRNDDVTFYDLRYGGSGTRTVRTVDFSLL